MRAPTSSTSPAHPHTAISTAGLLIALGIIQGDIGTSPLYTMKAIVPGVITQDLVYGGISRRLPEASLDCRRQWNSYF